MAFNLDCRSGQKALDSLARGFQCTPEELRATLLSIDLDELYEERHRAPSVPAEQYLYEYAVKKLGGHLELSSVVWFHCTRTSADNTFIDGISPLNESLEKVWDILLACAPEKTIRRNLLTMKEKGVKDDLYALRTQNSFHWGPYGILVRDIAFIAEDLWQHDYLKMPELVEDICNAYRLDHGVSLYTHYSEALKPKIVSFKSTHRLDSGCVESALGYAYRYIRGHSLDCMSVTGIDCEGVAISPEQITGIETLAP